MKYVIRLLFVTEYTGILGMLKNLQIGLFYALYGC